MGFKFIQMKGPTLFKGEIITKLWKYMYEFNKFSSPEPLGQFQLNYAQINFLWRDPKFVQMKGSALYKEEIITKLQKYIDEIKKSSSPEPLGQFQPNLAQMSCCKFWIYWVDVNTKFTSCHVAKFVFTPTQ